MRFWVWLHYWPQTSQLRAQFANMIDTARYCRDLNERGYGYTWVDTVTGAWNTNADTPWIPYTVKAVETDTAETESAQKGDARI